MKEFLLSFVLTPLSYIWEKIYIFRRFCYHYGFFKSDVFRMPIISVGNLTFGGTGKTPFTIWLTQYIENKSLKPIILTRGYRGAFEHSYGVLEAKKSFKYNPVDFGDEPLLIARRLKAGAVVVGKKRSENLKFFFDKILPDIGILDDGFQHLKLYRNLNIVLFDGLLPLSQYKVAPKGYLREGLTALRDANAIVVSRADQMSDLNYKGLQKMVAPHVSKDIVWASVFYRPTGVFDANYNKAMELSDLNGKNIIACAAVANPQSFFTQIEGLGGNIVEKLTFPDHYFFSMDDIQSFLLKSKKHKAIILTSEKDIVKIRKLSTEVDVFYMEVEVEFKTGKHELEALIEKEIGIR